MEISGTVLTLCAEVADVLVAIRHVIDGDIYFPTAVAAKLAARETHDALTPRELQALRHIVAGHSNKEIAAATSHFQHSRSKLDVADHTQAAIVAVRRRIVRLGIWWFASSDLKLTRVEVAVPL